MKIILRLLKIKLFFVQIIIPAIVFNGNLRNNFLLLEVQYMDTFKLHFYKQLIQHKIFRPSNYL